MRTALIDGDVLVYTASEHAAKETDWGDGLWTLHANMNDAIPKFEDLVAGILADTKSSKAIIALSADGPRWRNDVMPSYKAARKAGRRPLVYAPLRQFVHDNYVTFERPTLEGDDVLGILLTHPELVEGEKVCVSVDKDMRTLPGLHFNHEKPVLGLWEVTESEANYFHMKQALMGDTTDGYGGCPGVGPVSAEKILLPFTDEEGNRFDVKGAWQAVVKAYTKAGLSEAVALQNARVARICRHSDYCFTSKKVILWQP